MRKYSQVFLKNKDICARIARCVDMMCPREILVEIGPGKGALTSFLLGKHLYLCLVEIDPVMVRFLTRMFKSGFELINHDFLELDLDSLFGKYKSVHFTGNIPYQISTAIMGKLLDFKKFAGAVFMFQKEVAEKLEACPGNKAYGYLSALCGAQFKTHRLFDVSRRSFSPVPKVDSSVVSISPLPIMPSDRELPGYRKILGASFAHRRKTLLNSISISLQLERDEVRKAIESAGIKPEERAENLWPSEFMRLSAAFENLLKNRRQ